MRLSSCKKCRNILLYSIILSISILFHSCSARENISVEINQYTDATHVTGITKYRGNLYCATKGGLVKWDLFTREYTILTTADGLSSNVLTCIIVDNKDRLWVGTREGLCMYDGKTWKKYGISQGLPSPDITDLALDKSGKLWIATMDGVAFMENLGKSTFKLLAEKGSPGRKKINCIYFDRGENLWIGTSNNGIFIKMGDEWIQTNKMKGLPGNTASVITQSWDL